MIDCEARPWSDGRRRDASAMDRRRMKKRVTDMSVFAVAFSMAFAAVAALPATLAQDPLPRTVPPTAAAPTTAEPQRTSRLGGRAYLDRRNPIVGASVLAHAQDRPDVLYLTSTDVEGIFRIAGLPDGAYAVRIEREGLGAETKSEVSVKFPFRAVVEFDLDPVGADAVAESRIIPADSGGSGPLTVTGSVTEVNGGPVPELRLRFVRVDGGEDPRVLRSLPDGSFELRGVSSGVWHVEVSGVGYLTQRMAVDLHGDVSLTALVVQQPPDYDPTPFDLMPTEQPIPPAGFLEEAAGEYPEETEAD